MYKIALQGRRVGLFMNLLPDRYHTKANTELDEKEETTHSFSIKWRYTEYCTRKTVYEKMFFPVILSSERSHLTNLHSLCE